MQTHRQRLHEAQLKGQSRTEMNQFKECDALQCDVSELKKAPQMSDLTVCGFPRYHCRQAARRREQPIRQLWHTLKTQRYTCAAPLEAFIHKIAAGCQRLSSEVFHKNDCGSGGATPPALRAPHWRKWRRLLQGSALSSQAGDASLDQSALRSPILGGRRSCGATSVGHQAASPEARCTGKGRRRLRSRRPKAHLGRAYAASASAAAASLDAVQRGTGSGLELRLGLYSFHRRVRRGAETLVLWRRRHQARRRSLWREVAAAAAAAAAAAVAAGPPTPLLLEGRRPQRRRRR